MEEKSLSWDEQEVNAYANLPKIKTPSGERAHVKNADLWVAAKINSTLKKTKCIRYILGKRIVK